MLAHEFALGRGGVHPMLGGESDQALLIAISSNGSRIDYIHLHAVADAGRGHSFGERYQGGIYRSTDGELRLWCASACTLDIDQRAGRGFEMGPRSARQPDRPQELQRKSVGPILFRQVLKFPALGCAGVVHDDVDLSESLDSEFCQAPG